MAIAVAVSKLVVKIEYLQSREILNDTALMLAIAKSDLPKLYWPKVNFKEYSQDAFDFPLSFFHFSKDE